MVFSGDQRQAGDTISAVENAVPFAALPGMHAFGRDYVAGAATVMGWFDYDPHDAQALARRIAELDEATRYNLLTATDRGAWAAAAHAQQQRWGGGPLALEAARALGQRQVYTIATGQQVGLFGGPLYTVLKAVCAVNWARRLAGLFPEHRFVPVFWMGTSDSDFDEVRATCLLDQRGELVDAALPAATDDAEGLLVGRHEVRAGLDALLGALDEQLAGGLHREEVIAAIRQDYGSGGLAEGFARWMARLFSATELVLLDSQDPVLMQAARPLIRRELETAEDTEALLNARSAELAGAGYAPQLTPVPGDTGLFLLDRDGRREKLARDGADFRLRHSGERIARAELLTICDVTPERFVPGVSLRPIYQNTLFPVAAFVGGFAEIAYRAQIMPLFHHHGQQMAPAFVRASATLLPAKSAAQLDELGLELTDCLVPPQDLIARVVDDRLPADIEAELAAYRRQIEEADGRLLSAAVALDPSLEQAFSTLRGNLERHVDKLEKKITSALKHQHETLVQQARRLHNLAYPRMTLQERLLPALSLLPRTGFGLVAQLLDELAVPDWQHRVVILE